VDNVHSAPVLMFVLVLVFLVFAHSACACSREEMGHPVCHLTVASTAAHAGKTMRAMHHVKASPAVTVRAAPPAACRLACTHSRTAAQPRPAPLARCLRVVASATGKKAAEGVSGAAGQQDALPTSPWAVPPPGMLPPPLSSGARACPSFCSLHYSMCCDSTGPLTRPRLAYWGSAIAMSDVVVGSKDVPPPPPGMPLYPPPGYSSTPYAGAYPYYPPPPPPPKAASGSGFPPWVWVALGVVLAGLGGKLLEGAKSKQADLQQAMMQQMLKSMMGAGGPGGGAVPPFPGAPPSPYPPRPQAGAASKGATVDTTATAVKDTPKVCASSRFVARTNN
jgi:hypothetical protein